MAATQSAASHVATEQEKPRRRGEARTWKFPQLTLASQFLVMNLFIMMGAALALGFWVGRQIEDVVVDRTAWITALYVNSIVSPHLQTLAHTPRLDPEHVGDLAHLLQETALGQHLVSFKVWSMEGEILYNPDVRMIGRRFPVDDELALALQGYVNADLSALRDPENEFERQGWTRLLEVYAPVREGSDGRVIAVMEFYQLPDELDAQIAAAQQRSWAVVVGIVALVYLLLAGIVKRGSDTIAHQQATLHEHVAELSTLLEQNTRLHERLRQAAGRMTTLREQALRRVSADLHDGPGQALALALLQLDALQDRSGNAFAVIRGAVRDALKEIRSIAAGLRMPELALLTVTEVAERAVRDHQQRSGTPVDLQECDLPAQMPLPNKIVLLRTLQEALSNATRHGQGIDVRVRLWTEGELVNLAVSDGGPGFVPEQVDTEEHLGLAGMRERAEVLEGHFTIDSAPGRGTTVQVSWPLTEVEIL